MSLFERVHCCQPLPHVLGFPKLRVLSADPTPIDASILPCFVGLSRWSIPINIDGPPVFARHHLLTCHQFKPRGPYTLLTKAQRSCCLPPITLKVNGPGCMHYRGKTCSLSLRPVNALPTLRYLCSMKNFMSADNARLDA